MTADDGRFSGIGATPRTGVGTARWYRPDDPAEGGGEEGASSAADADPEDERERFEAARDEARAGIERDRERAAERVGEDEAEVFDAHLQFLDDPELASTVGDRIGEGERAETAVREAFAGYIDRFEGVGGRTAERADDLRDVRDRVLRALTGAERESLADLPDGTVLLAERLTPSDTAELDPERVAGVVTIAGGRTSHAAIIARSLGVPAVVGVGEALSSVEDGAALLVDGESGVVVRNPGAEARAEAAGGDGGAEVRHGAVATTGGKRIEVAANVGTPPEVEAAVERGADGVGLFRTEFLFHDRPSPPDEDEQFEAYVAALDAVGGSGGGDERAGDAAGDADGEGGTDGRVVVRTLDMGGDKPVPYLDLDADRNGFLGVRGIRLSLDEHAALFETQLRALLRAGAAGEGDLAVMFPMVTRVEEFEAARGRVEEVMADLEAEGEPYAEPELGAMVETPAAVAVADALAERAAFLSVGTNDLTQYTMAADRGLDAVADLHDPLHPAVVRALAATVESAHDAGAWVGVCGEMAGDPDLTELLVGLGVDELSMAAVTVPDVKRRVAELDDDRAAETADRALAAETLAEVRSAIERNGP